MVRNRRLKPGHQHGNSINFTATSDRTPCHTGLDRLAVVALESAPIEDNMAFLIHRTAGGEETKLPITTKPIVLGRGIETDIRVEDDEVSRAHCAIWLEGEKFLAKDLRSRNGTFVNGQRVNEAELKPGDRVRIGQCEFVIEGDLPQKGISTIMRETEKEMMGDQGKGFRTILREVVKQVPDTKSKQQPGASGAPRQ